MKEHKILKKKKCDYNDKYSRAFHKLIRSDVIDEFREYNKLLQIYSNLYADLISENKKKLN